MITVGALVERFLGPTGYAPVGVHDLAVYRRHARSVLGVHVVPLLGDQRAESVTSDDVERLRDQVALTRSASRVVSVLGVLSVMYQWARRHGLISSLNPCDGVARPRVVFSTEYYERAEVRRMLAMKTTSQLHAMVAVGVFAGLRKGELFGLRWRDVVVDASRLDIRHSYDGTPKSGRSRHIPLHKQAAKALEQWRPECPQLDELVFPVRVGRGALRMGRSTDLAGLPELLKTAAVRVPTHPWHALRHTFASHLVMSGASLSAVQVLLGHSSANTTMRYAHLAPDYLAAEMRRLKF